jgi:hypothetical protein
MDIRVTTIDSQGRFSEPSFQWAPSFSDLVEQIQQRGVTCIVRQGLIRFTVGEWTKEIQVINPD